MALGLRYFTGKIFNFASIVAPRNLSIVNAEKISKQLLNNVESGQYSTAINYKIYESSDKYNNLQVTVTDNRETENDEVIKENVLIRSHTYWDVNTYFRENNYSSNDPDKSNPNKPSPEKLYNVYNVLRENLPNLFIKTMDYSIYHPEMIFEDNIRGIRTVGLYSYVKQVALLRTVGHFKFAYVMFEILKITQHPEDSTVKIRWRIRGISALKVMLTFWKYRLWNFKEIFDNQTESWYDGFSTFYVNVDGFVVKHVADKMMPDSDSVTEDSSKPLGISAAKLALLVGIIPRFSELNSIV
ncbi:hypothetical protein NQ318_016208 [Aromia moschata]|uniref:Uncharacterized protein n=1 Tax=Aromia moschata TaxID=1265417 RepID=A0AAV8YEI8_9CUCU|nr:hypothetical protein NQ318_016208 [Aromia moschata]